MNLIGELKPLKLPALSSNLSRASLEGPPQMPAPLSSTLGRTAREGPQTFSTVGYTPPPSAGGMNGGTDWGAGAESTPITGRPGYTPDYSSLIQNDGLYQQLLRNLNTQGVASAAQRKQNTDQALIKFGQVPDLQSTIGGFGLDPNSAMYKNLFGDVDQNTIQGAQDMTNSGLSTVAGLSRDHTKAIGDLLDSLAARGAVQSGATGTGGRLEDRRYGSAQFTARNDLLSYLSGVQSAFNQSQQDIPDKQTTGLQDATTRQINLNPVVPGTGSYASGLLNSLNLGS